MEILIIAFLIILNGVFSMSEIALVSSRKFKLEMAAKKGNENAKRALKLANSPNTFLSAVQIGITLVGILTGIFSGAKITDDLRLTVEKVSLLKPYSDTIAVVLVVLILTYFSIVFGELIPKKVGLIFPEKIATIVAGPMGVVSYIAKPFIWLLGITNDFFFRIFGIKNELDGIISEEEIKAIVQDSAERGEILNIEQDIVSRVFSLGDRNVRELMTHRTDLTWLDISDDLGTIKMKLNKENHSAYPVSDKKLDKIAGIVHIKDLFFADEANFKLQNHLRKPVYVHETMPAYRVLEEFKKSESHYAVVVDEYAAIEGLISIDDILDALVGDYPDHNDEESKITQRGDNSWIVDGQLPFHEFLNYFKIDDNQEGMNYITLGGLVLYQLKHIPVEGEKVEWKGFELEVGDMDDRRIDKIFVTYKNDLPQP